MQETSYSSKSKRPIVLGTPSSRVPVYCILFIASPAQHIVCELSFLTTVVLPVMVSNTYANGHVSEQGSTEANGSVHVGGDQYLPRSILITGGAGFIASHVVTQLLESHPQYKVRSWLTRLATYNLKV